MFTYKKFTCFIKEISDKTFMEDEKAAEELAVRFGDALDFVSKCFPESGVRDYFFVGRLKDDADVSEMDGGRILAHFMYENRLGKHDMSSLVRFLQNPLFAACLHRLEVLDASSAVWAA